MKVCFLGDVVGLSGRNAVKEYLSTAYSQYDLIIVNGENAAHGFGINLNIALFFFQNHVNVITLGNHAWDQKGFITAIDNCLFKDQIVRPINFPSFHPGKGFCVFKDVLIINLISSSVGNFTTEDPFISISNFLKSEIATKYKKIIVDFHAEKTSEKNAMGHFLNGKVSAVLGTHTHIPTSDFKILQNGTAYITDAGMCGDYNSIIGFDINTSLSRFLKHANTQSGKLEPATGKGNVSGVVIDIDDNTGKANYINNIFI